MSDRYHSLCFLLLLLLGCQPYIDHEILVENQVSDFTDLGQRRQLKILRVQADRESLLISFNQPLRWPTEKRDVPFTPTLFPHIPIKSCEFEGVSQVRVGLSRSIPAGIDGQVTIPAGWRALSGASLVQGETLRWIRSGATVTRFETVLGEDRSQIRLEFDEEVSFVWVAQALHLWDETDEQVLPEAISLAPEFGEVVDDSKSYLITLQGLKPKHDYRISMESALKNQQSDLARLELKVLRLPGEGAFRYISGPSPLVDSENPEFELEFSESVKIEELERCLRIEPSSAQPTIRAKKEFCQSDTSFRVAFEGPAYSKSHRITIAEGLRSDSGSSLDSSVEIVPSIRARIEQPLPVTRAPARISSKLKSIPFSQWPGKETRAWSLTWRQALKFASLSDAEWKSPKLEPAMLSGLEESAPYWESQEAFLSKASSKSSGYFLVSRDNPKEPRRLLVVSKLSISYTDVPGAIVARVEDASQDTPVGRARLEVVDLQGKVLARSSTDQEGYGRLSADSLVSHPGPLFLRAETSTEQNFVGLSLRPESKLVVPKLDLNLEKATVRPNESLHCYGFGSLEHSGRSLRFEVREADTGVLLETPQASGQVACSVTGQIDFQVPSPQQPGDYVLVLRDSLTKSQQTQLFTVVSPLDSGESYRLDLPESLEKEWEKGQLEGRVSIVGPRARHLGVRVISTPSVLQADRAGWMRDLHSLPRYTTKSVVVKNLGLHGEFSLPLDDRWADGSSLTFELYDRRTQAQVLDSKSYTLKSLKPHLSLNSKLVETGSATQIRFAISNYPKAEEVAVKAILQWRRSGAAIDSWEMVESKEFQEDLSDGWTLDLAQPGEYRILATAEVASAEYITAAWRRSVESPQGVMDLDPTRLSVRPGPQDGKVRLTWLTARVGEKVWLSLSDLTEIWTRQVKVGPSGLLGSFELPDKVPDAGFWAFEVSKDPSVNWSGTRRPAQDQCLYSLPPLSSRFVSQIRVNGSQEKTSWLPGSDLDLAIEIDSDLGVEGFVSLEKFDGTESELLRTLPPLRFEATALELQLTAPTDPGQYRFSFSARDLRGRESEAVQEFEVESTSTWTTFGPRVVRFGDRFFAGIEAKARSGEPDALGLTAIASLGASILPDTYLTTSALVSPGETGKTSFEYSLDEENSSQLSDSLELKWKLGIEGTRHDVLRRIPYDGPAKEPGKSISGNLSSGQQRKLALRWDNGGILELRKSEADPESSVALQLQIADGKPKEILIPKGEDLLTFTVFSSGIIGLKHLEGPEVTFQVTKLKTEPQKIRNRDYRIYSFRTLSDQSGEVVDLQRLRQGEYYRLNFVIVCPEAQPRIELAMPLPGSLLPLSFSADRGHLIPSNWTVNERGVDVELVDIPIGESRFSLTVVANDKGTYKWPVTKFWDGRKKLISEIGSETVTVSGP